VLARGAKGMNWLMIMNVSKKISRRVCIDETALYVMGQA